MYSSESVRQKKYGILCKTVTRNKEVVYRRPNGKIELLASELHVPGRIASLVLSDFGNQPVRIIREQVLDEGFASSIEDPGNIRLIVREVAAHVKAPHGCVWVEKSYFIEKCFLTESLSAVLKAERYF